ncbi:hypothetical protein C8R43DRAFT_1139635 [Mycena crocata]|nr:hypothetical protein C8R43DRAFT_1139635 [Mycena crocata]
MAIPNLLNAQNRPTVALRLFLSKHTSPTLASSSSVAWDVYGEDYTLVRDMTIRDDVGELSRFSFKDLVSRDSHLVWHGLPKRSHHHLPTFIGQICKRAVRYEHNPVNREGLGTECFVLTFRCPSGADADTVICWNQQVQQLLAAEEKASRPEASCAAGKDFTVRSPVIPYGADPQLIGGLRVPSVEIIVPGKGQPWLRRSVVDGTIEVYFKLWMVSFLPLSDKDIGRL